MIGCIDCNGPSFPFHHQCPFRYVSMLRLAFGMVKVNIGGPKCKKMIIGHVYGSWGHFLKL